VFRTSLSPRALKAAQFTHHATTGLCSVTSRLLLALPVVATWLPWHLLTAKSHATHRTRRSCCPSAITAAITSSTIMCTGRCSMRGPARYRCTFCSETLPLTTTPGPAVPLSLRPPFLFSRYSHRHRSIQSLLPSLAADCNAVEYDTDLHRSDAAAVNGMSGMCLRLSAIISRVAPPSFPAPLLPSSSSPLLLTSPTCMLLLHHRIP
jgi:hypothetical protein